MKLLLILNLLLLNISVQAAHQHGLINIEIAIDKNQALAYTKAPMDDLYKYQRENRKKIIDDAISKLTPLIEKNLSPLFKDCKLSSEFIVKNKNRYSRRHIDYKLNTNIECPKKIQLPTSSCFKFDSFPRLKELQISFVNLEAKSFKKRIKLKKSCPNAKLN